MPPREIKDVPGGGGGRSGAGKYRPITSARKPSAPSESITAATSSTTTAFKLGIFCHFCGDYAEENFHQCTRCSAIICQQKVKGGTGCIAVGTVRPNKPFFCPLCSRKEKEMLPYVHHGFINRQSAKLCWPMCLIHIRLERLMDGYAADATNLEIAHRYSGFRDNVCGDINFEHTRQLMRKLQLFTTVLQMKKGAQTFERNKVDVGCALITRSIASKVPANVFIVVDTHSEEFSGMLQHTGGKTEGSYAGVDEILAEYLGEAFREAMQSSSDAARNSAPQEVGSSAWYDRTAYTRGGWRGVFLLSCGPAVNVTHHFERLLKMVEE